MEGSSFAVGFSTGMGSGIAVGISIGASDKKSLITRLKRKLDEAVANGQIVLNDADGNAMTGEQLFQLLQQNKE
ncbi:MAG: hypothetical protein D6753_06650 [Planctomycetota bacterium]|nr:MAG: hypothetical protein D6753_06650 [Planctomycetota bacterium]